MYFVEPLKTKLVAALRSGDYFQITDRLTMGLAHGKRGCCCLGVACDVADPNGWKGESFRYKGDSDADSLPGSFAADFVLNNTGSPVPVVTPFMLDVGQRAAAVEMFSEYAKPFEVRRGGEQDGFNWPLSLANLNDDHEIPFPLLADFIEAHC